MRNLTLTLFLKMILLSLFSISLFGGSCFNNDSTTKEQLDEAQRENEELATENVEQGKRIKALEEENVRLGEDNATYIQSVIASLDPSTANKLQADINYRNDQLKALRLKSSQLTKKLEDIAEQINQLSNLPALLELRKKSLVQVNSEIASLEKQPQYEPPVAEGLKRAQERQADLNAEIAKLEELIPKITEKEQALSEVDNNIAGLEIQERSLPNSAVTEQLETERQKKKDLSAEIAELRQSIPVLANLLNEQKLVKEEQAELDAEINRVEAEINGRNKNLRKILTDLQNKRGTAVSCSCSYPEGSLTASSLETGFGPDVRSAQAEAIKQCDKKEGSVGDSCSEMLYNLKED